MSNSPAMNPSTSAAAHLQPSSRDQANQNFFSKFRSILSDLSGCRRNHAVISSRTRIQPSSPGAYTSLRNLDALNNRNNLTGRVAQLETTAQQQTATINQITERIADQDSGMIKLLADLHRHEGINANKWSNQSRTNQEHQDFQDKLETELNACNNDINEVAKKLIEKLTRDFDRVKIDIDALRPHIRTNANRIYKNRLDTLNTQISTLFTPIGQNIWTGERNISKLTKNVDSIYRILDQSINTFKTELNNIANSLNRPVNTAGRINDKDRSALAFIKNLLARLEDSKQTLDFVKSLYTHRIALLANNRLESSRSNLSGQHGFNSNASRNNNSNLPPNSGSTAESRYMSQSTTSRSEDSSTISRVADFTDESHSPTSLSSNFDSTPESISPSGSQRYPEFSTERPEQTEPLQIRSPSEITDSMSREDDTSGPEMQLITTEAFQNLHEQIETLAKRTIDLEAALAIQTTTRDDAATAPSPEPRMVTPALLQQSSDQMRADFNRQHAIFQRTIDKLVSENESQRTELQAQKTRTNELEHETSHQKTELETQTTRADRLESRLETQTTRAGQFESRLETQTMRINELEREASESKDKIESLNAASQNRDDIEDVRFEHTNARILRVEARNQPLPPNLTRNAR